MSVQTPLRLLRLRLPSGPVSRVTQRRFQSSQGRPRKSKIGLYITAGALVLGGGYVYSHADKFGLSQSPSTTGTALKKLSKPAEKDYQAVYEAIAEKLEEGAENYDDGSFGPVLVRLAWHASGTYDKETGTGGSNGATMRFAPESDHGANAGLKVARDIMESIHKRFPWISYSDLWTLGGVVAIQEMQGPTISWRPGRSDKDVAACSPDGRLPDASKDQRHLRDIFYRMGWNDQEIVALSGAHALGRGHPDRSGYSGPWTFSPTMFTNDFFKLLLDEKWQWKKWNGPEQHEDKKTQSLMMLPTDMALIKDKSFKKWVDIYANDQEKFFEDFGNAFSRLLELGVPFEEGTKPMRFKTLNA
ncbi:Cytochrome c peroxidase, mitochondrial [Neolecta irregularis DAH-3]|uniref:Peroxidase n=1 Tax=Neolecta irregularis (strain DAH-3) TaxID=1198029 RepID=A0A1U7LWI2_NEOID|nr:Cytochrome c peroxidase, mitochondrial [Neolecta irregularis DAH-3]|eukprot:OLL26978.1 Cytochrome c peroxidase, mitochondrial [Neolecta irregularis DAH-3]